MSGFALTLRPRHVQIDMDSGALSAGTFVRACFMLRAPRFAALHFPTHASLDALDFPGAEDARRISGLDIDGLLTSTWSDARNDHWAISFNHQRPPAHNFDVHGSMAILLTTGGRACGAVQLPAADPDLADEPLAVGVQPHP